MFVGYIPFFDEQKTSQTAHKYSALFRQPERRFRLPYSYGEYYVSEQILDNIDKNPHAKRQMNTAAYLFVNEFVGAVIVSTVDKINADEIKQ